MDDTEAEVFLYFGDLNAFRMSRALEDMFHCLDLSLTRGSEDYSVGSNLSNRSEKVGKSIKMYCRMFY